MIILGIETSCDETAAAVIETSTKDHPVKLISTAISTSLTFHAKTGGIIPEVAARQQLKFILPVIENVLEDAKIEIANIDAIAITYGPGLIGSLLVGAETAKTLSYVFNKPLIPVNHLIGHLYANWIQTEVSAAPYTLPPFPSIGLIVSGGHTDLVLIKQHGDIKWLGGTRDDAAGEALDKIGRLLGLPYPAGPTIEKLAKQGDHKAYNFPRPMADSGDFDFSFSGLKTAVLREVQKHEALDEQTIANICRGVQDAIVSILVKKTTAAAVKYQVKSVLLGGGVAANQSLKEKLEVSCEKLGFKLFVPTKSLCTDNAAMIAAAGFYNDQTTSWKDLDANPELYFD